jgi:hypothetical protein
MGKRTKIPLRGSRTTGKGDSRRGLVIKSSDCESFAPPRHVNQKHAEIQRQIDRRRVKDSETHGWIEHDGEKVTAWEVDDELL